MLEAPKPSPAGRAGGEEVEPGRAGGRPGGGGGMAEPSGAETRPPIRVTVKTPKDKEEIVICDRASVKEVVRVAGVGWEGARRRGLRRGGGGESAIVGHSGGPGREARGPSGRSENRREGETSRGRPARVIWRSLARAGEGRPGLPCGLGWGRGGERGGNTLHREGGRTFGLNGACASGFEAPKQWGPGKVLSRESGRRCGRGR